MRVTNSMILSQALHDLDGLRAKYARAQAAVNGRVLERPSEDPQRVVEAMDLSGAKLRLERALRSGQDAHEWLSVAENSLSAMIEQLHISREIALQAGSPVALAADSRESLAESVLSIRDALAREMNGQHREQYLFAGWNTSSLPFRSNPDGGVTYDAASEGEILRDVAPGLSVPINVSGTRLLANGDFLRTLTAMAEDLRSGRTEAVSSERLADLDRALDNLTVIRSDLGVRQNQVEQYEMFTQEALFQIEDRLGIITGADLETAVLRMTEAQTAYQVALASFAKALPTSLVDYMLR